MRYPRDARSDPQAIAREVLVPIESGMGKPARMVPLGQVAAVSISQGPPVIRTENALLSAYIYVDIRDRDIGGYVKEAQRAVRENVDFPPGMYVSWSGQFEYLDRAVDKLKLVVPLTLAIIFVLLFLSLKRVSDTLIVMLSVPFSLVGGIWFLWALDYNMSVAVAVGFIALAGVAAETGVVMIVYLNNAWEETKERCTADGRQPSLAELGDAVMAGAVERVRPKVMTVVTTIAGAGADHVDRRHGRRGDASHRRADGRRHDLVDRTDADRDPGDLHAGQDARDRRATRLGKIRRMMSSWVRAPSRCVGCAAALPSERGHFASR